MSDLFISDLAELTRTITANNGINANSRLGDAIQYLGSNGLLLRNKKDEDFNIHETIALSDTARDYLNALQTEKLFHCRLCYHKNDEARCDFHKKYIFKLDPKQHHDEYIDYLNTEMGIISFVELYYTYLNLDFWKMAGQLIFKDLTGFSSVRELLKHYSYECSDDVDDPVCIMMDE